MRNHMQQADDCKARHGWTYTTGPSEFLLQLPRARIVVSKTAERDSIPLPNFDLYLWSITWQSYDHSTIRPFDPTEFDANEVPLQAE